MDRRHFLGLMAGGAAALVGESFLMKPKEGKGEKPERLRLNPQPPENLPVEPSAFESDIINKKESVEQLETQLPTVLNDEINLLAKDLPEEDREKFILLAHKIYAFENSEIVRLRLSGDAKGAYANKYFGEVLSKPKTYERVLEKIAHQHDVPFSLLFSVLSIEGSGRQKSKNRFQLGPDTARAYGLEVEEGKKDERTHFEKSAHAAARYLKYLHGIFGNQWGLALVAYNSGAHRLSQLIDNYFKDKEHSKIGHDRHFPKDVLQKSGINIVTLYKKEQDRLMSQDKAVRFELRSLWYPFAATALGAHGEELLGRKSQQHTASIGL